MECWHRKFNWNRFRSIEMKYYVVKYTGPFGFIKPWSAVRDELTYSQTYLSPATIKGLSQKLFGINIVDRIKRYRLQFDLISEQQEQTWAPLRKITNKKGVKSLNNGIITRGILLNPVLYLAFETFNLAKEASEQHVCLCRNEDILFPDAIEPIREFSVEHFEIIPGFELIPTGDTADIPVGFDRYAACDGMMYGKLIAIV
jgi:hypothetical protein